MTIMLDLGDQVADFRLAGKWLWMRYGIGVGLIAFGLILLGGACSEALEGNFQGRMARGIIFGVVCLVLAPLPIWHARRNLDVYATVFQYGIYLHDKSGEQLCHWTDIVLVTEVNSIGWENRGLAPWWELMIGESPRLLLVQKNGSTIVLKSLLPSYTSLREAVQGATLPLMLPRALEFLEGGRTLDWGKIRLTMDGIHHGADILPWSEATGASVGSGKLRITRTGNWLAWLALPVELVPNTHVIAALIKQLGSSAKTRE